MEPENTPDQTETQIPVVSVEKRRKAADFSRAVRICSIKLKTDPVQTAFEHHYRRADNALFAATKMQRSQGKVKEAVFKEKILTKKLDVFSSDLSKKLTELQATIESSIPETMRKFEYEHVRTFDVPSRSGFASRLINLTLQLDELVSAIDVLEINGALTPDEAYRFARYWLNYYRVLMKDIQDIRNKTADELRQQKET